MAIYLFLTLLVLQFTTKECTEVTFKQTLIQVLDGISKNSSKDIVLTGQISPETLIEQIGRNVTVLRLSTTDQIIPVFHKNAVTNLPNVGLLKFTKCSIESIRKEAFVNLPKLWTLDLSNNEIETVEIDAFVNVNLDTLDLSFNKLVFLEYDVFATLTNLLNIFLSNNQLEAFEQEWFGENKNLEWIDLSYNSLRAVQKKTFSRYRNLTFLDIHSNRIRYIHKEAFVDLSLLGSLILSDNKIKKIDEALFSSMAIINELWLDRNNLTFLFQKNLNDLNKLKSLSIHSNPWQCGCYDKIIQWAVSYKISIRNPYGCFDEHNPVCVYPSTEQTLCLENIEEDLGAIYFKLYDFNKTCLGTIM